MPLNKQYIFGFLGGFFVLLVTFFYLGYFFISSSSFSSEIEPALVYGSLEEQLAQGNIEYLVRCAKCHGNSGEGGRLAPSLIDEVWLYGDGSETYIYTIAAHGTPSQKMRGWATKLRDEDIRLIAKFVKTLSDNARN